jgi:integrase
MGQLYRRRRSRFWWCKYYVNGRPIRESTGREKEKEAARYVKEKEGRAAAGLPVLPRADRVRYEEAESDLRQHYEATGTRDLGEYGRRVAHLTRFFRGRRVAAIGQVAVDGYIVRRQEAGAKPATIRRELTTLTKMLRLAYRNGKLIRLPLLDKPKEGPAREGFFEREQFLAVRRHLSEDLQVAATIAYTYGWRMQSEVLGLERRQLDLEAGTLRLDPGTTKNDEGRVVYLTPELKAALAGQVERVDALQRRLGRIIPFLFPHRWKQGKRAGAPRGDFRKAWTSACRAAGVAGRLRHDFRRTAVRNLVNAGVPERVAMTITGHKTRSVFDRYHIVSPGDLQEATRKLTGTLSGTLAPASVDSRTVSP